MMELRRYVKGMVMSASREWVEVNLAFLGDAGDLLARLNDPSVAGAWQDNGTTRLYWPATQWGPGTLERLKRALRQMGEEQTGEAIGVAPVPVQDWNEQWARSVTPIRIGRRIVIRPSWAQVEPADGDVELVLDPKQAFGTGHHATTALLLERLEELIHGGELVLDVGTGSGILAMAALRLGAKSALGIDHDPVAIECAREYASLNRFGPELDLRVATLKQVEPVPADLVLANLDRKTLLESARFFEPLLEQGARLLVSGILPDDKLELAAAFAGAGGAVAGTWERDGWLALEVFRPDSCEGGA